MRSKMDFKWNLNGKQLRSHAFTPFQALGGHFYATPTDPWSLGPTYNASAVGEERVATGLGLRAMGGKVRTISWAYETFIMLYNFII